MSNLFLILVLGISINCCAQRSPQTLPANLLFNNAQIVHTDSGFYIIQNTKTSCKDYISEASFYPNPTVAVAFQKVIVPIPVEPRRVKFLTVHGNVAYEYYYRSAIDTPISQKDFKQHTERVYLDVLVKEKYPLRVNFTSRQSNSPFFRNYADINLNWDRFGYNRNIKQQLLDKLKSHIPAYRWPDLANAEAALKKYTAQLEQTQSWLTDPLTLQRIIEERERIYYERIKREQDSLKNALLANAENNAQNTKSKLPESIDSGGSIKSKTEPSLISADAISSEKLNNPVKKSQKKLDSLQESFAQFYEKRKASVDSLKQKVAFYKSKVDSLRAIAGKDVASIRQKILRTSNEKELRRIAEENGLQMEKMDKMEKRLMAVRNFSIGRSVLDYTELTAQNITVTGLNIEYNPSYYAAFAAGKIDYRFGDFLGSKSHNNSQYIVMGRLGVGDKDKKALIFSYFTGKKSNANYGFADSANNYVNLLGYSVEAIYRKDQNTFLSAEFAKSTKPVNQNAGSDKQTGSLIKFKDNSNMGINIKGETLIPETHTRLSGFFRKTGEQFQSFSLFTYNSAQTAWLTRVDQSFFKDRVIFTGMLRRNDFSNPFTDKTYKTSTVFKSAILNVRFRKYPNVSIGYYPGTQLFFIDKEKIRESAYYILNGTVNYSYRVSRLLMYSTVVYNRYSSEATDSGFVPYNGVNIYALQALQLRKLDLEGGYAFTRQAELKYQTFQGSVQYQVRNWLNVSSGLKLNTVKDGSKYWGENILLRLDLKKIGSIHFQYEKSYLPTINNSLAPVEIGRVGFYKKF